MREIRRSMRKLERRGARRVGRRSYRRRSGCFVLPVLLFLALMYIAGRASAPDSENGGSRDAQAPANTSHSDSSSPDVRGESSGDARQSPSPGDLPSADAGESPDAGDARTEPPGGARGDYRTDPPEVRTASDIPSPRWSAGEPVYHVSKVVDGDTIRLSNDEKVRLIGVDTPETVHPKKPVEYYGREASAFTKREMDGRDARMTYGHERRDHYGRLLAYVWRRPDDFFINAEIISQGYGFAYTKYPFEYVEEFRALERTAREERRGLWGEEEKIGEGV